jgi:hypothetical protein
MRQSTHIRHAARKIAPTKKAAVKKIKRVYSHSLAAIKKKPLKSLGFLTLGAGLLSGIFMLSRWKH